jgi:hypothetical protein
MCRTGKSRIPAPPIDMLPDEVLLDIFDFWNDVLCDIEEWHTLVHVCQRWRQIAFASPQRLNLEIYCTPGTPVRKNLGIWPALPIAIEYPHLERSIMSDDEDNIIAALEHPDRVNFIALSPTASLLEKITTVMQEPFPALTYLGISLEDGKSPVLPTKFLGGSAPRLDAIEFQGIPFPALPTLLLSASNLGRLHLDKIPPNGYISPEAMVAGLVTMPRLRTFSIGFQSATSHPDRMYPPPATRTVLPALTCFAFEGTSEYLEDLVARVDSPQLNHALIDYFDQFIDFQVAQLSKFINRSVGRKSTLFQHAHLTFFSDKVSFHMHAHAGGLFPRSGPTYIGILCEGIDWQVSHMAQVLRHLSVTLSHAIHLKLELGKDYQLEGTTDDVEWHLLLYRFSAVQTLHVSSDLAGHIAAALEDMAGGMFADSLPSLDLLYLEDQPTSSVEKFVAARQLSGRSVTVVHKKVEFDEKIDVR